MTNWTKHTGDERPAELAPAQVVEVEWPFRATPGRYLHRVSSLNWLEDTFYYRPTLDPDGLPYVSADGLEHWARYVATDSGGWGTYQFKRKPNWRSGVWRLEPEHSAIAGAPDTHAIPGSPENSLARVWRE